MSGKHFFNDTVINKNLTWGITTEMK